MHCNTFYVIGHITIKDTEKWAEYRGKVPATLSEWGAEVVFRGKRAEVLTGKHGSPTRSLSAFPARPPSATGTGLRPIRR